MSVNVGEIAIFSYPPFTSHLGQSELAVRQCVERLRRADTAKGLAKSSMEILAHVQSVQDARRRRVEEQLLALKRERDQAQQRVRGQIYLVLTAIPS